MEFVLLLIIIIIVIVKKYKKNKDKTIPNTNLYSEENEMNQNDKKNQDDNEYIKNNQSDIDNQDDECNENAYEKKEYLLTRNELKFYKQLKKITDKLNLTIFAQVSLYQIIKNKEFKDFNKIRSKSIDFVITEANGKIRLCIELDDATHNYNSRIERDNFVNYIFKQSNLKLLRIPVQDFYNLEDLERKITEF